MSEKLQKTRELTSELGVSRDVIRNTVNSYGFERVLDGKSYYYPEQTRLYLKKVFELRGQGKKDREIRALLQLNDKIPAEPIVHDDKVKELLEAAIMRVLDSGGDLFNGRGLQIKIEIANVNLTISPV